MVPVTPAEALEFLDKTSAQIRDTRPVHKKIEAAIEILKKALDS